MADQWHYRVDGVQHGPVTSADLKSLAGAGQLKATDLVWKEGLDQWVAASSVKGLLPVSPPSAATPPPPPSPPPAPVNAGNEVIPKAVGDIAATTIAAMRTGKPVAGFHVQKLALAVASVLGILATFMPWATLPVVGTIYGTAGDGWVTLALFVPALVLAFRGDRLSPLQGWTRYAAAVPAGLAGLIGIQKIVGVGSMFAEMVDEVGDNPFGLAMAAAAQGSTRTHFGLYLLFLAGASIVAATLLLGAVRPSPSID